MRILMASKRAPGTPGRRDGGVQTWTTTVAAELRRLGHEVEIIGATDVPKDGHDVGIFANTRHTAPWSSRCAEVIAVSHGIVADEDPAYLLGRGELVFTSEEVRAHWNAVGAIIRQPIDLEFWSPAAAPARRTLVRYANRGGLDWLPEVAACLGLEFQHVRNATPEAARAVLRDAAVVLASGRCAVEAAACGAPVVVLDDRHYQGPLMETYFPDAMAKNYSGRGGLVPDPEAVAQAVRAIAPTRGWRGYAEKHHDVRKIVPQLLEVACSSC